MTTLEKKTPEAIEEEIRQIRKWLTHKPSKEQCKNYASAHTRLYKNTRFYIFKFNRERFGSIRHTLSTSNMHNGNILEIKRTA